MDTSTHIKEAAENSLLPAKSSGRYWKEYELFMKWCQENSVKRYTDELALMAYFKEKSKTLKCSTLWAHFSMLKITLNIKHHINIENYLKLIGFLRRQKDEYVPIKPKTLKIDEFQKFIAEAPNENYLMMKAALIIGMSAACRRDDLVKMSIEDVQDRGDVIIIKIPDTKTQNPCRTCITEPHWIDIIREYTNLRPPGPTRFFLFYSKNKCTKQPVGIHTFGSMPSKIAAFLNLENPERYNGRCFRQSSADVLAGHGTGASTLKRCGGWKSSTVTEGYSGDSKAKITTASQLVAQHRSTSRAPTSSTSVHQIQPSSCANYLQKGWTMSQIEALIDQYKRYPVLYDRNHEEYENVKVNSASLANIVEALQTVRLGVTDADVTSQWDNLTIKYIEVTREQQARYLSETIVNWEPQFWYLEKLQFLKEHIDSTEVKLEDCGTIEYDETKLFDPQNATEIHEWGDSTDSLASSLEIKEEIEDSPPAKKYKDEDSESSQDGTSPDDEYDCFAKFVASQLRKITDDEVRQDTVFEFHKLLHKALKKK